MSNGLDVTLVNNYLEMNHIVVCICTFNRKEMLRNLLYKLNDQVTDNSFTYSAVIVDNDFSKSAKNVVESVAHELVYKVEYFFETIQNIALARNKTVENAKGNYVAFIDDDEFPPENWLLTLYTVIKQYCADGVLGPVKPSFEKEPPQWIIDGKFYEKQPQFKTGKKLRWEETRTSNVLMKNIFDLQDNRFRKEFGRGGEDRDFFKRMIEKRYIFVWCAEAFVYEIIPPERCTRLFMVRRALLRGKMSIISDSFRFVNIFKSLGAFLVYAFMLPFLLFLDHHIFMKFLIKISEHLGVLIAFAGFNIIKQNYVIK